MRRESKADLRLQTVDTFLLAPRQPQSSALTVDDPAFAGEGARATFSTS